MALSVDSKLKDILRNPEGKAIIEKYTPNLPTHPALKMIQMMSLRKLFSYPEAAEYAVGRTVFSRCLDGVEQLVRILFEAQDMGFDEFTAL